MVKQHLPRGGVCLERAGDIKCQVTICRAEEKKRLWGFSQASCGADKSWDTKRGVITAQGRGKRQSAALTE